MRVDFDRMVWIVFGGTVEQTNLLDAVGRCFHKQIFEDADSAWASIEAFEREQLARAQARVDEVVRLRADAAVSQ